VEIASTTGVRVSFERTFAEMWIDVVADDGRSTSSGSGYWWGRGLAGCDVELLASMAVNHALGLLGPRADVLDGVAACCAPEVVAVLMAAAGRALTAPLVRSRRGPLPGGIGATVAAPVVTLVDDGLHATSKRAAPIDDEGVPRQRTALITGGAITGMLQSTATLRGEETSTGNAYRGSYKSPPSLAPTTLTLAPTTHEDLRSAPGDVIYISQLSGDRSGISPVSGRVDIAIAGCLLRDGEPVGAFTAVPVSTTLSDLLGHVEAVGDDARLVLGSAVLAPTIRLSPGWLR
jgi:PmbA protein